MPTLLLFHLRDQPSQQLSQCPSTPVAHLLLRASSPFESLPAVAAWRSVPSGSGMISLLKFDVRLFRKLLYQYLPAHLFNITFGGVQQFMRIQKGQRGDC
jgi:hypothetical protein